MLRDIGRACEWKNPRAPCARAMFEDERATDAALASL